ncbi:hypothetical protein THZG08_100053 [Vibrio owensii]|nr:hypothetical protein THZG08_100053 [Vibrio owensii]CAH1549504.1 hypothetical protein THOA03_100053 [Vibrio owensii]
MSFRSARFLVVSPDFITTFLRHLTQQVCSYWGGDKDKQQGSLINHYLVETLRPNERMKALTTR